MKTPVTLAALLFAAALPAQAHVVAAGGHAHPKPVVTSSCSAHAHCKPARVWVPKAIEFVDKQVWIAPQPHQIWVPPVYETRCGYGGETYQVLVKPGHYTTQWTAGHYETVTEKIVVPGHWEASCKPVFVPKLPKVVLPHLHGPSCGCGPKQHPYGGSGSSGKKKGKAKGFGH